MRLKLIPAKEGKISNGESMNCEIPGIGVVSVSS